MGCVWLPQVRAGLALPGRYALVWPARCSDGWQCCAGRLDPCLCFGAELAGGLAGAWNRVADDQADGAGFFDKRLPGPVVAGVVRDGDQRSAAFDGQHGGGGMVVAPGAGLLAGALREDDDPAMPGEARAALGQYTAQRLAGGAAVDGDVFEGHEPPAEQRYPE